MHAIGVHRVSVGYLQRMLFLCWHTPMEQLLVSQRISTVREKEREPTGDN